MQYNIDKVDASKGPNYEKAKKFGQILIDNCELDMCEFVGLLLTARQRGRRQEPGLP